jgi:hypothetical protein
MRVRLLLGMHHPPQQQPFQDEADRLLAQASKIGLSMFNEANVFWNVGKEKVLKVYAEQAKSAISMSGAGAGACANRGEAGVLGRGGCRMCMPGRAVMMKDTG